MPEPEPEAAEPGIGVCECIRHEPTTWPIRGGLSWMGLCARQTVPAAWLSVWMAVSVSRRNLTYLLEVHYNRGTPLRTKETAVDDAREKSKRGSTADTNQSLHPSLFAPSPFSHTLALTPPDPETGPRNRTQEPGQGRPASQHRKELDWAGRDRTGQGRQGHRPGTGIVTTRHRPTPTLPRRNTVSQSAIYRRPAVSPSCVRRGEA